MGIIGLDRLLKNSGIVPPIQGDYDVSKEELNILIKHLETVSRQINKQIYLETTKTDRYSKFCCLNPSGSYIK
ncbi:MAG: hypothetical protein ACE5J9_07535 [Methanosarcinales archaeon]